mgnify:CR=1 FL=1
MVIEKHYNTWRANGQVWAGNTPCDTYHLVANNQITVIRFAPDGYRVSGKFAENGYEIYISNDSRLEVISRYMKLMSTK